MAEKKLGRINVRIPLRIVDEINLIAEEQQRSTASVIRLLLQRGLLAYNRDGLLIERDSDQGRGKNGVAA